MSEDPKLLPCPFCGGGASIWTTDAYSCDSADHVIGCQKCDVYTPFAGVFESAVPSKVFVDTWNTRTDHCQTLIAEAVAAEREACAELCDVVTMDGIGDIIRGIGDEIRARTHADALAALEARDKRVRADALREASIFDLIEEMKRRHNPPRTGLEKVDLSRAALRQAERRDR